ncbi:hypothetical protein N7501_006115 [Penicillium viridicatum]|nr:hypothetical protein N7501_006115 [Penicillium viridicatum]
MYSPLVKEHARKPRLIWVWICMGLNDVDVFMHRHPSCYGTLPLWCLIGATVRWWSRGRGLEEEEKKKRRGRVEGSFYMVTSRVPS